MAETSGPGPGALAGALAETLRPLMASAGVTVPVIFVSGAQGIGKSTAVRQVGDILGRRIVCFSLDDLYLTREARQRLARDVHPLFTTRGPPGTHDLGLGATVLSALGAGRGADLPLFDKRSDDRLPRENWPRVAGGADAVVVEGWMMGALPDADAPRAPPLNEVEGEDRAGTWRQYQETQLADDYAAFWDLADAHVHLVAPSFAEVLRWRTEQEAHLRGLTPRALGTDHRAQVGRFIQHFERITRRMMDGARRPGSVIAVDAQRRPITTP